MIHSRVFWKVCLGFIFLILFTNLVIGSVVTYYVEQDELRETEQTLKSYASLFGEATRESLDDSLVSTLQERVHEWNTKLGARFTIIRLDGKVVADSYENPSKMDNLGTRPEVLEARDKGVGTSTRFSNQAQKNMMNVALPIRDKGTIIGYSRVSFPLVGIDARLERIRNLGLIGGITGALIALLVLVIARRLALPSFEMTGDVHSIAEGSYDRVPVRGNDEFSKAAQISHEVFRHDAPEQAQHKAHDESGKRVEARTEEHSDANTSLEERIREYAEETLRGQQEFLRDVVDSDPSLIFVKDWNGKFTFANKAMAEVYGTTVEGMLGKCDADFNINQEEVERFLRDDREVMESGQKKFIPEEPNTNTSTGEVHWFQAIKIPLTSPESDIESRQILGVATDITERKRAEEALRASEQRFSKAFNANPVPMSIVTYKKGQYIDVNESFLEYSGYTREEVIGRTTTDIKLYADPGERERLRQILRQHGRIVNEEVRRRVKGGEVRVALTSSELITIDGEQCILTTTKDITERKQAEVERAQLLACIQEQREQLSNIIANVPGIVWETLGQPDQAMLRCDYVSDYAEWLLGYSVEEWLGTPNFWLTIVHPDDKERAAAEVAAIFAGRKSGTSQFRWLTKDDRVLWVEAHHVVVCDEKGNPIGMRGVTMDITARKEAEKKQARLEQQLRQAQKMESIGTLAGGVAHDFNNILAAIIGYSELASDDLPSQHSARSHLAEVLKASNRAKELVQQILTFSRQQGPERKPTSLKQVLEEALKLLRALLPVTIEIRQHIDQEASLILGDPSRIHEMIMNLATNALHAMGERGGTLEAKLERLYVDAEFAQTHAHLHEGNYLRLIISDNGCGMDRYTQERIFEPFFTTKEPGEGTGLGLAMVYGIVKDHDGAISLYSEPGVGTTFNIYFPVHETATRQKVIRSKPIPNGHGQRVLFVDDEESLALLGKERLERFGYEVTAHTNSIEALEAFHETPDKFDLIITDYTMPHMNGADLAKYILKARPELPVILVTGYSSTIHPEMATSIGIRELLMKPTTAQDIGDAVYRVLANQRKV